MVMHDELKEMRKEAIIYFRLLIWFDRRFGKHKILSG
jgi:hypothetical protein